MDILNDVLTTLRLRGTVYFQADFRAPWGMDIKGGAVASFHLVVDGECWLRLEGGENTTRLAAGDLVVLPQGERHSLLHAPDADTTPAESLISAGKRDGDMLVYGGRGNSTRLICGHYEYDRRATHLVVDALPSLIHLRSDRQSEWMKTATELTVAESSCSGPGSNAVVNRLSEVLLIQVIRRYAHQQHDPSGFLAALTDPALSKALTLFHEQPGADWQLDQIARSSGVSKTVLTDKFRLLLGIAPIQYLTRWRLLKAREVLIDTNKSIAQVADMVGYRSEWAFSKAFKRAFGTGPGSIRKQAG